ncbi:TadA family conjugal transfer-associated ATPase [Humibacillus xanthopallidus]|uniref:Pilus assembly protein CpaF n=1 Tax=Humibacillus xanthopallidus TaxID=412689 RepID=A0A543I1S6_9MICO|nr:TadA family conjugal transfer-associated ATPase [Humibacillus xanthopallidus]TQM64515.1 pilus assembly protein CpaF [Humibacillus xanthopallidus]
MSLSPAVWQRVREGVGPDVDVVSAVAREEVGALGARRVDDSRRSMASRVLGAGVLDPFLSEPHVTDVAVNGDGWVWIDRGDGMEWTGERLSDDEARLLAVRLAGAAGRRLDEASPWVDGQLPSGARLHAILPPLVADGAHITIRVPSREQASLVELGERGMFPPEWLGILEALVRRRLAFLVSGGTGAGKTTLLASLLGCADRADRLLLVEDVRELDVDHPHVVRLEARPANVEGAGEVTLTTLVRQSLRMRPDRIVVGEVRGAEVRELLAALNTGHEGGCGTIHANAPADVLARLEALGALAGLGPEAVRAQAAAALDVVLHVVRDGSARRLSSVAAVLRRPGGPVVVPALDWGGGGSVPVAGAAWPVLSARLGLSDGPPDADGGLGAGGLGAGAHGAGAGGAGEDGAGADGAGADGAGACVAAVLSLPTGGGLDADA